MQYMKDVNLNALISCSNVEMPYNWVVVKPLLAPPEVPDAEKKDYSMQVCLYIHSYPSISHTKHYRMDIFCRLSD